MTSQPKSLWATSSGDRHPLLRDYFLVLAAYLGLAVLTQSVFKTITVWPSAGVALAAFLVFGSRIWPSIALGTGLAVLAYFIETAQPLFSAPNLLINLATVVGNTLAAAVSLRMCGRLKHPHASFAQFDWVASKFLVAIFVFGLLSALPGVGVYWLIGQPWADGYPAGVAGWMISNGVGALVMTPLLVKLWMDGITPVPWRQGRPYLLAAIGLLALAWFLFGPGQAQLSPILLQPVFILIPLVFVAVTCGQAFSFLLLALTFFAVWVGTTAGYGPFIAASEAMAHASMQAFIGFSATVILLLQALVAGQKNLREQRAEDLRQYNRQLEQQIQARTAELEAHVGLLRQAQRIAGLGNYVLDLASGVWTSSPECDQLFGIDATYVRTITGWSALIHPDQRGMMEDYFNHMVLGQRDAFDKTYRIIRHHDGAERWVHGLGQLEFDAQGQPQTLHGTIQDITARKQAEAELRIAAIAFQSQESMMITDAQRVILRINPAFTATTGYTAEEAIGRTPGFLKSDRHDAAFYASIWRQLAQTGTWQGEVWDRRKNGEIYPKWLTLTEVKDDDGVVTHYVGAHQDITERNQAADQVRQLAFFDPLTQLPNRRLLNDRLSQAMMSSQRSECHGALMFLDLDNFKPLNDTHGHVVGDLLLMAVADRLTRCVRGVDTVARFGGDEFVVILSDLDVEKISLAAQAATLAEKISAALSEPYALSLQRKGEPDVSLVHHCTASIGVALFFDHECSAQELLKRADWAMYQAKAAGRNSIRFHPHLLV